MEAVELIMEYAEARLQTEHSGVWGVTEGNV
jgi:hypothetical protein